jgi:hypothetical protein
MILVCFASCVREHDPEKNSLIPLESEVGTYHVLNLGDYVTDLKYIPLETNDTVLISGIESIVYENGNIIILSDWRQNECFVFNDNGVFSNKIGERGQGPDDYLYISRMFLYDDLIYVQTFPSMFMAYHPEGKLMRKIKRPEMKDHYRINSILPLKQDVFYLSLGSIELSYYPKIRLIEIDDTASKIIKEYTEPVKVEKDQVFISNNEYAIDWRFKDEIRFYKYTNCDTIFTVGQDMEIKDAFILNLGKYKPTPEDIALKNIKSGKGPIRPDKIMESSDYLFFQFSFSIYAPEPFKYYWTPTGSTRKRLATNATVHGVFNKNTQELKLMKQPVKEKLGFNNDMDSGPVIWPHYVSSENELVTFLSPEAFLDYYDKIENPTPELKKIAGKISPDDNPIVIIAKLKD